MADRAGLTRSLTVQIKCSISGTCYFLCAQFRFIPRSVISVHSGSNHLSEFMRVILNPHFRYNLCTCVIPSAMFLIFRFLIILPVSNIMCRDTVLRKPILFMCMRSQKILTYLYLARMVLGTLVILTGSTCWMLCCTISLLVVICWVHRYPRSFQHLLVGLKGYSWCYYRLREGFTLLVDPWYAVIALHDQLFFCRRRCILSSCPSLMAWGNVSCSSWCAHLCSWGGAAYHDRTGHSLS